MADTIKFSQLTEITRPQMAGTDYAVGYKANGDNKKWTFENQADFLLNDSEAGQEFQETFVKVQNAEPTDENNKIWIQETPESEVEVPTYDEFKDLSNLVSGVNEAVFNKLSATVDQVSTYIPFTFSTFAGKRYIIKNESSSGGMLARIRQTRDGENGTYITNGTQAGQTSAYEAAEDADYIAVMFGPTTTNPAFSIIQEGDVPSKVEEISEDVEDLKSAFNQELYPIEQQVNKTYDDSNGVYFSYNGYSATLKLHYNSKKMFYGKYAYQALYWDKSGTYLGYTRNKIEAPANAYFIAFTWYGTTLIDCYYSYVIPAYDKAVMVENILHTDDVALVNNSAWDDSANIPKYISINNYIRSESLILFNKNATFITSPVGLSLNFIFFNANKQKVGTGVSLSSAPNDTYYFVFNRSAADLNSVTYNYFNNAASIISNINIDSQALANNNGIVTIPLATTGQAGAMSSADKQKLDAMISSPTITINGSGVTKNASAYGFLPTNDGDTNAENLQTCIDHYGGGTVLIDFPGVYKISKTLLLPSNTEIIFGEDVYIERALDNDNIYARHIFVNAGVATQEHNENICIKNLKVITDNVSGGTADRPSMKMGMRGLLAFYDISNLKVDGFELIDHTFNDYAILVAYFENIHINNIHIETLKDGIHLGKGKGFVIRNCRFLTNDDALAFNAVDYPESNIGTGTIENGIIENITFLNADGISGYSRKRGVLLLSGAWKNWASGDTYQVYGDYCLNNGVLYQSYSPNGPSTTTAVSTSEPTHLSGMQTYADGFRWVVKDASGDAGLYATIRNVSFKNICFERSVSSAVLFSTECSSYLRAYHNGANLEPIENITFDNIRFLSSIEPTEAFNLSTRVNNLRVLNSELDNLDNLINIGLDSQNVPINYRTNLSFVGNYYDFSGYFVKCSNSNPPTMIMSICGSMKSSGFTPTYSGITPTTLASDL